eukprot:1918236-Pleurochrysis_carterae.AAC.1
MEVHLTYDIHTRQQPPQEDNFNLLAHKRAHLESVQRLLGFGALSRKSEVLIEAAQPLTVRMVSFICAV